MSEDKNSIIEHYDASANTSHELYNDQNIFDTSVSYPANYFRLQLLLRSFKSKKIKNVLEIGVGEGTPLSALGNAGMDVWGFDISSEMVKKSKDLYKQRVLHTLCATEGSSTQDSLTECDRAEEGISRLAAADVAEMEPSRSWRMAWRTPSFSCIFIVYFCHFLQLLVRDVDWIRTWSP